MENTPQKFPPFSNIAVVGGTPFDSGKGAVYLSQHGIRAQAIGISEHPSQQAELYHNPALVEERFEERAGGREFSEIIIYCNSLSFITDWAALYRGRIFELTAYYRNILENANLPKLAIIVAEENTVKNLREMADRKNICDSSGLHIFSDIDLINKLEESSEEEQFGLLKETLKEYEEKGFQEILLGCTHLDHPEFSDIRSPKIYQPGLSMLNDFIRKYDLDKAKTGREL